MNGLCLIHRDLARACKNKREETLHLSKALQYANDAIAFSKRLFGDSQHSYTLSYRGNRVLVLIDMERFDDALKEAKAILKINEDKYSDKQHRMILYSTYYVATVLACQDEFKEANEKFESLVRVLSKKNDPSKTTLHSSVLLDYARCLLKQQRFEEARTHLENALAIRTEMLGESNPRTLEVQEQLKDFPSVERQLFLPSGDN